MRHRTVPSAVPQSQKTDRSSAPSHSFSAWIPQLNRLFVVPVLFYVAVVVLTVVRDNSLPDPKTAADTPLSDFSEERARVYLNKLVSFGVRTTGNYPNEVLAPQYILEVLTDIKKSSQSLSAKGLQIEIEVQRPSGSFNLDFIGGFSSAYQNVTNILVRISFQHPETQETNLDRAVLVSAHYDSSLGSPGASDDISNIANMMEMVRNLVYGPPLSHSVIFNFNGAEETILQASHGFITQHPWAASVRAFINLEGAGGNGRELVFQIGPRNAWLAEAYAKAAPYPFFSIVGQEIFQTGVIPSDTDFRIYRDYGRIPGLDVAYISNGYIYHTFLDDETRVEPGSLQRCGENILATVRAIASSPLLPYVHKTGLANERCVYYDLLGIYTVVYSMASASAMNSLAIVLALLMFYQRGWFSVSVLASFWVLIGSVFLAIFSSVAVALILSFTGSSMKWFAHSSLIWGLFAAPAYLGLASGQRAYQSWILRTHRQRKSADTEAERQETSTAKPTVVLLNLEQDTFLAGVLLWLLILAAFTVMGIGSAYIPLYWVVCALYARYFFSWFLRHKVDYAPASASSHFFDESSFSASAAHGSPLPSWFFLLSYFGSLLIPSLMSAQLLFILPKFFIPLMGRAGSEAPADIVIAVMVALCISFMCFISISLIHLDVNWSVTRRFLFIVIGLSILAAIMAPSPFVPAHPKRLFVQHMDRKWHSKEQQTVIRSDSGLWVNSMDSLKLETVRSFAPEYANLQYFDCESGVYGDVPYYFPVKALLVRSSFYIPAPPPVLGSLDQPVTLPPVLASQHQQRIVLPSTPISNHHFPKHVLELVSDTEVSGGERHRMHFRLSGPDHMIVYVDALSVNLTDWSFALEAPSNWFIDVAKAAKVKQQRSSDTPSSLEDHHHIRPPTSGDGETYFIYLASGNVWSRSGLVTEDTPVESFIQGSRYTATRHWEFWMEIEGKIHSKDVRLAVSAHYLDHLGTPELVSFSQKLPDWVAPIFWVSSWDSYIF